MYCPICIHDIKHTDHDVAGWDQCTWTPESNTHALDLCCRVDERFGMQTLDILVLTSGRPRESPRNIPWVTTYAVECWATQKRVRGRRGDARRRFYENNTHRRSLSSAGGPLGPRLTGTPGHPLTMTIIKKMLFRFVFVLEKDMQSSRSNLALRSTPKLVKARGQKRGLSAKSMKSKLHSTMSVRMELGR